MLDWVSKWTADYIVYIQIIPLKCNIQSVWRVLQLICGGPLDMDNNLWKIF